MSINAHVTSWHVALWPKAQLLVAHGRTYTLYVLWHVWPTHCQTLQVVQQVE